MAAAPTWNSHAVQPVRRWDSKCLSKHGSKSSKVVRFCCVAAQWRLPNKKCLAAGKIGMWHCTAVLFTQVPKKCTERSRCLNLEWSTRVKGTPTWKKHTIHLACILEIIWIHIHMYLLNKSLPLSLCLLTSRHAFLPCVRSLSFLPPLFHTRAFGFSLYLCTWFYNRHGSHELYTHK